MKARFLLASTDAPTVVPLLRCFLQSSYGVLEHFRTLVLHPAEALNGVGVQVHSTSWNHKNQVYEIRCAALTRRESAYFRENSG